MTYRIHWKKHGILTEWTDETTSQELIQWQKELQSDERFDALRYSIHDYQSCTKVTYAPEDMDEVGAIDGAGAIANPNIVVAIIAPQPELTEMIEGYKRLNLTPYPIKQFTRATEALEWLKGFGISASL